MRHDPLSAPAVESVLHSCERCATREGFYLRRLMPEQFRTLFLDQTSYHPVLSKPGLRGGLAATRRYKSPNQILPYQGSLPGDPLLIRTFDAPKKRDKELTHWGFPIPVPHSLLPSVVSSNRKHSPVLETGRQSSGLIAQPDSALSGRLLSSRQAPGSFS